MMLSITIGGKKKSVTPDTAEAIIEHAVKVIEARRKAEAGNTSYLTGVLNSELSELDFVLGTTFLIKPE